MLVGLVLPAHVFTHLCEGAGLGDTEDWCMGLPLC